MVYKYAMENDYVVKNYAQFIKLPPLPKSTRDAFNAVEIESLWYDYHTGHDFTGYILILIYTVMRLGELQQLKKENIDLSERVMIGGIKTEAGIDRRIVIANKILPIVTEFYNRQKKLLEMQEKDFYAEYYAALERASARKLTPHCCRHTFATLMAESGAQPAIIKTIAGHEKYETTLHYTHLSLESLLTAIDQI